MCQIKQNQKKVKGGIDLSLTCSISGKPITISNQYGMFCEDMCELKECKKARKEVREMIKAFSGAFPKW